VLDAPEERYATRPDWEGAPYRRAAAGLEVPRRGGSGGKAERFAEDDEYDGARGRRSGVRLRFDGGLIPRTLWGRIAAGVALAMVVGSAIAGMFAIRSYLLRDEHFIVASPKSIQMEGNAHVTRAQMLSVFGGDVERSILAIPLDERRAELERMPWVAHATVMRLLPNRLRVGIVERTPVAFVREGAKIGLVDAHGVLLTLSGNEDGAARPAERYSFPVLTGIGADDPLSTRAARMKIYGRFTADLDGSGEKISQELSEVDLSNPEDVRALIPDHSTEILVHFGDTDFLDRYRRFQEHLPEWRTVYPKLSSVDMRYERQVVLEMQPGSAVPVAGAGQAATGSDAPVAAEPKVAAHAAGKPAVKAGAKAHSALIRPPAVVKTKPAGKMPGHGTAQNDVAYPVTAKPAAARAKTGKAKENPHKAAAAKHNPRVVRPSGDTPQYHPPQVVHQ